MRYLSLAAVILLLMTACREPADEPYQVEVTNETLRREIIAYHDKVLFAETARDMAKGDSIYTFVYFKALNDSMTRYSMEYIDDLDILDWLPAEFVSCIGGHTVFFSAAGGFFGIPQQKKEALLKRYFPKKYAEIQRHKEQDEIISKKTGMKIEKIVTVLRHPTICHLTFLRDSLIDKQYELGMCSDKVKIHIDGKDVWM